MSDPFNRPPQLPEDAIKNESNEKLSGKMLIVDDEPSIVEGLSLLADMDGYEVITTSTPQEVTRILSKESNFRVMILDNDLTKAGNEGIAILEKLTTDPKFQKTVFVLETGKYTPELEARVNATRQGVYFMKPVEWEAIVEAIRLKKLELEQGS
jgi:DNA-binding NtrC family response regulator